MKTYKNRLMNARELRIVLTLFPDDDSPVKFAAITTPGDDLEFDPTTIGSIRQQLDSFDPEEPCMLGAEFVIMGFACHPQCLSLHLGRITGSQLVN